MGLRGPGGRGNKRKAKRKHNSILTWQRKGLSRTERVIRFLESLPITKGHLVGKKMKLLPSQREFIETIYGKLDAKGRRIVRLAVQSLPRGNGKSSLLAGLSLAHLLGPEALDRGAVFSAAVDRNQASILFDEMKAIIEAVPEFEIRTNIMKHWKKIEVLSGAGAGSVYEALSSDARRGHGLAPSFFVFDELGQMKDRELLDALMTAMGKQPQSLGIVISTQAATDDHPLSQLIDDGLAGLDPSIHVQLIAAPPEADLFSEDTWRACNPAYGIFLDPADFKQQAERARRMPSFMGAFKNHRLNQRVASDPRLISKSIGKHCTVGLAGVRSTYHQQRT